MTLTRHQVLLWAEESAKLARQHAATFAKSGTIHELSGHDGKSKDDRQIAVIHENQAEHFEYVARVLREGE